jgi:hypothetical protein
MFPESLKIPKKLKQVTLWVHPEGRVVGFLFLRPQSLNIAGEEEPLEVLNQPEPFLVLKRQSPDELRFYNKSSIIWVEYVEGAKLQFPEVEPLRCKLHLMDGSFIEGSSRKDLPPDHARLLDFLNLAHEHFVKVYADDGNVYLVNKSYIICVTA